MTIFDARYDALIRELTLSDSVVLTQKFSVLVSISLFVDNKIFWISERSELNSFRPVVPRLVVLSKGERKWYVDFFCVTTDGRQQFSEQFLLIYEEPTSSSGFRRAKNLSFSLSNLRFPGVKEKLFARDNRVTRFFCHTMRLRALKARRGIDRSYVPFKRVRRERIPLPITDGSLVENRLTNFVRQEGSTVWIDSSGSQAVTIHSRSSVRTGTPNFFKLKKSQRPVNPYTMEEVIHSTRQGIETVKTVDQSTQTSLSWMGPTEYFQSIPAPDYSISLESDNKAYKTLLSNLDRSLVRESSQVTANIVQFRQVVNMIAKNSSKILRSYKALKRLDFRGAEKALFGTKRPRYRENGYLSASQSLSRNWLELQYGWKPLLHDIKAVVDTLHRDYHGDVRSVRGVGVTSTTISSEILGPRKVSLATVSPFPVGTQVIVKSSRVEYGLRYSVSDQDRVTLAQTGFLSPVSLVWELIPFSFVVDWFYPIGPYLESLSAFEGLSFLDGYKTTFVREQLGIIIDASNVLKGTYPQRVLITSKGGAQRTSVKLVRTKLVTFPSHPRISIKNPISVGHAANAVALLVSNFRR